MKYDPKNMCHVDEPYKQEKTYDYDVTFHLVNGEDVHTIAYDQPLPKREFINAVTYAPFTLIEKDCIAVNMRNVLYMTIKEIGKDE